MSTDDMDAETRKPTVTQTEQLGPSWGESSTPQIRIPVGSFIFLIHKEVNPVDRTKSTA